MREERLWRVAARSRQGHQLDPCPCLSFLAHIQGAMEPGSQGLFPNPNEPSPRSRFHPCMRSSLQAAHPRPSWTIISRPLYHTLLLHSTLQYVRYQGKLNKIWIPDPPTPRICYSSTSEKKKEKKKRGREKGLYRTAKCNIARIVDVKVNEAQTSSVMTDYSPLSPSYATSNKECDYTGQAL